jgi:hypothetical protein
MELPTWYGNCFHTIPHIISNGILPYHAEHMIDANHDLASAWVTFQHLPKDSDAREELEWAWERLDDLCSAEPDSAWQVIQEIIARDQSDKILADVGALA